MRKRTLSREFALKILYQLEVGREDMESCIADFWSQQDSVDADVREFTDVLVRGVAQHHVAIDRAISSYATNWQLNRMAAVDRNILRIGSFELLYLQEVPAKVAINEAVELAKKYSDVEAGKFVNGVLDKVKLDRTFKE